MPTPGRLGEIKGMKTGMTSYLRGRQPPHVTWQVGCLEASASAWGAGLEPWQSAAHLPPRTGSRAGRICLSPVMQSACYQAVVASAIAYQMTELPSFSPGPLSLRAAEGALPRLGP